MVLSSYLRFCYLECVVITNQIVVIKQRQSFELPTRITASKLYANDWELMNETEVNGVI